MNQLRSWVPHPIRLRPSGYRTPRIVAAAATLALCGVGAALEFVEVGADRGIQPYEAGSGYGTGVAAADFDDDGDIDLFVANGRGVPDQVYRNRGDGHFDEVAADLGLASTGPSRTALWLDYDGDGRLDLLVAGDCFSGADCPETVNTLRAYRQNDAGTFDDVSATVMPADDGVGVSGTHRSGMVAGDLDGDGWVDVIVGQWGEGPALLLRNEGGRRFVDVAGAAGIATPADEHWQPAILDVDGDGRPDIYWAVDFTGNRLWMNQGDLTFVDAAPELGIDNAMNDMGLAAGDYDRDGDLDLYVTEIRIPESGERNVLFRNDTADGDLAFTERAVPAGVEDTGFGWGCVFLDADLDGWPDLAVTNGWFNGVGYDDPSRFFRNLGPGPDGVTFVEQGAAVGFDDTEWGASLVAADLDGDGDEDLVQTCRFGPVRLLENRLDAKAAGAHSLTVRPRMPDGPNGRAIGAVVRARSGDHVTAKLISAGTSHLGQVPAEAVFGLGTSTMVGELVVSWPDGAQSVRMNVPADGVLTIERSPCPGTADLDGDGTIGFPDLVRMLSRWGPCTTACPHDVDGDGTVGADDLTALFGQWGVCGEPDP